MNSDFLTKVKSAIDRHGLLSKDEKIIVAVSGGADSVALLSALVRLGYECIAAHCNFHLRGEESNRDMRFVQQLAAQFDIDLYVKEFDVASHIAHTGESIEMACRSLRYEWFNDLLDRERAKSIAVGHHREDQIETFFLNLLRGAGVAGLAGMRHRNGHIVRPLLDLSRNDIELYLNNQNLGWVDDSTNNTDKFARNNIRLNLIPFYETLFPGIGDAVLRSMEILRENATVLASLAHRRLVQFAKGPDIDLSSLIEQEPYASAILFEDLKNEGFSRQQTDNMLQSALSHGGEFNASKTHTRHVDHGFLRAPVAGGVNHNDCFEISISQNVVEPVKLHITLHDIAQFSPERDSNILYIDADVLNHEHRWTLRRWQRGDRMIPFGMKTSKLISDIFADAKYSKSQKSDAWLLTCDNQIVWIVGLKASALFTLGPSTKRFIRISLNQ